jgi:hypothetical protein
MAGMAHSSFPQSGLLFRFFFPSTDMPRAGKVCPGFSAGKAKFFISLRKKSQAETISRLAICVFYQLI